MTEKSEGLNPISERPEEPNWSILAQEKDLAAGRTSNVHKLQGAYESVKKAWEVGELIGWEEKTREMLRASLENFERLKHQ